MYIDGRCTFVINFCPTLLSLKKGLGYLYDDERYALVCNVCQQNENYVEISHSSKGMLLLVFPWRTHSVPIWHPQKSSSSFTGLHACCPPRNDDLAGKVGSTHFFLAKSYFFLLRKACKNSKSSVNRFWEKSTWKEKRRRMKNIAFARGGAHLPIAHALRLLSTQELQFRLTKLKLKKNNFLK